MSDETVRHHLEAIIRHDGRGEVRDGDLAQPMQGGGDDELRALVMQHVIGIAGELGGPVRLRTVDVDGVYHLVVFPDGEIAEEGEIEPLLEGDTDLWSDDPDAVALHDEAADAGDGAEGADAGPSDVAADGDASGPAATQAGGEGDHRDGGYAALFGLTGDEIDDDDEDDPHETVQLPRSGMMRDEPPAITSMHPIIPPSGADARTADDEPAADGDAPAIGDEAVLETVTADDHHEDSEAHDDGADDEHEAGELDDDEFDGEEFDGKAGEGDGDGDVERADRDIAFAPDDEGDQAAADEPQYAGETADAARGNDTDDDAAPVPAPEADAWQPEFPRGRPPQYARQAPEPAAAWAGEGAEEPAAEPERAAFPAAEPEHAAFSAHPPVSARTPDLAPFGRDVQHEQHSPAAPREPERPFAANESLGGGPTLNDFLADKSQRTSLPAERGWRASLRRTTGGLVSLGPGARERQERSEIASIQRTFDGPKTIVVVNPKGGAHKTTTTLMIAAMFGMHRGGYTLAWDNNETRGTLGWRSHRAAHNRTAVDLLRQLSHFEISGGATIADVDRFVRNQGEAKFDVLASDDDAASAAIIDAEAFSRLHRMLSRFYRVLVIDTGNNMRASNWEAALDVADQLVIVSTAREDTAASAAWLADGLRERGHTDKLSAAVTILSSPSAKEDAQLTERLRQHFAQLTRAVVEVPYDEEFVGGGELDIPRLRPETREAWRRAAAVIAQGL